MNRYRRLLRTGLGAAALLLAPRTDPLAAQGVTVGGLAYGQYLYQLKDTADHANNFSVTRAYINVVGRFSDGLVARITPDVYTQTDGSLTLRLKYAYAAYTPANFPLTFKLGLIHTPWLDWAEGVWDYRMQGTISPERNGYITSSDLGFGIDGVWSKQLVNAQVGLYNGEGYHGGVGDKRKDVMGRVSVRLLASDDDGSRGGLRVTLYGQYGKPTGGGERTRLIGMISYKSKLFTLATEGTIAQDSSTATPVPELSGRVLSGFGVFNIPNTRAAVIARVDLADPDKDVTGNSQTRFIGGISYVLHPHLRLLADLDYLHYEGTPTPAQEASRAQGLFQIEFTF
jgi:hypothetical protein